MDFEKNQKWFYSVGPGDPMAPLFLPTLSPKLDRQLISVSPPKARKKRLWWLLIPAAALAVFAIMYFLKGPVPDAPPVSMETAPDQTQSTVYTETMVETTDTVTEAPRVPSWNVLRNPDFNKKYSEISEDTPSLHPDYSRKNIRSITFYSDLDHVPVGAVNIAEKGTVLAWVTPSQSLCDLHIAAEGGVMAPDSCRTLFAQYGSLEDIRFNNSFDTSNVTDMSWMFYHCHSLTSLDLGEKFDTSYVTNMGRMFSECLWLTTLNFGEQFDTSNVTDMGAMFNACAGFTSLNLGEHFDTSNVTNMSWMFSDCLGLTSLNLGTQFDTSNVTNMNSMFVNCIHIASLNLGNRFDTSKVTDMWEMFGLCGELTTLDLGEKFDMSSASGGRMFSACSSLEKIIVNNTTIVNHTTQEGSARYHEWEDLLKQHCRN